MSIYNVLFDNVLPGDTVRVVIDGTEHAFVQKSPFVRDGESLGHFCAEINADDAPYTAEPLPDAGIGITSIQISGASDVTVSEPLFVQVA